MPRKQPNKDQLAAREQFNDLVADTFARIHKDQGIFYVGSTNGNSAYSGRRITSQKATLAQAVALTTASRGDTIIVDPFHAETTTAVISPVAGSVIKGLKVGNKRPIITINGAIDMFSFTAASCEISGLECTIASTDAATAIVNFAAARCKVSDLYIIPSVTSYNVVDVFTVATGGDSCVIENTQIFNTTVAVNSFLNIEAAIARLVVRGNRWYGDTATGGLIDAAVVPTFLVLENNVVATIGTTQPAFLLDGNAAPLIAIGNHALGTSATIADNTQLGNLARRSGNFTLEATDGSASATQVIPAADVE
jgi:hypothetical protein